jgi:membrane peptidoglycan carboxypeptidase
VQVPNPLLGNPAAILGTNNLSPLTLVTAYAGVANGGKWCTPVGIDKIVGADGKDLPVTPTKCTQGVDPNVAAGAIKALQGVVSSGTGTIANPRDGVPILGKTGTTDSAAQNWFVSSTTKTATVSWVGQTKQTNGNWVNFGNFSLNGDNGRNAKLHVAKPVIAALNKLYGGDPFPQATGSVLQAKQVTVPDLTGKSPAEAQSTLEGLGFAYQDGGPVDSALPAGVVASTNPPAGGSAGIGAVVTVYTSKGNQKAVPDVTGKPGQDAAKALSDAGFNVAWASGSDPTGTVVSTDPAANTAASTGSTVTIKTTKSNGGGGNNGGNGANG